MGILTGVSGKMRLHRFHLSRCRPLACAANIACCAFFVLAACEVVADDWPTFRHDQRRSGVSNESTRAESLVLKWQWDSSLPPAPAWPDSARWDAYAKLDGLRSMRDYDPVFHPVIARGRLYLASNSDDTVRCMDLQSGDLIWARTLGAPVRVAPTIYDDRVFVGCDDGHVYALSTEVGEIAWSKEVNPGERAFLNDGRLCSQHPVRTGVLVDSASGCAVAAAGVFPWKNTALVGLSLLDGREMWRQDLGTGWTLEGAMLLGGEHIVAPQGRSPPQLFARSGGQAVGPLSGGGGSFALLTEDDELLHGPGNKDGWITTSNAQTREKIASFTGGTAAVVHGDRAYLLGPHSLSCVDRNAGQLVWRSNLQCPHEVILVGDTLFTGGDEVVAAINAHDGRLLWARSVRGRAIGLAFSDGRLVVSTDTGQVSVWGSQDREEAALPEELLSQLQFKRQHVSVEEIATGGPQRPSHLSPAGALQQWFFHADLVDCADEGDCFLKSAIDQGRAVRLPTDARLIGAGQSHALVLDEGIDVTVAQDFRELEVPRESLTIIATVRIDRAQAWGGLLSVAQDNGSYEKGWMLGFRNNQFGLAVNCAGGPDRLTWTLAREGFTPGQWYQVVATYDGDKVRVYVNGKQSAESQEQSGAIVYPDYATMNLGSYRDDDERFFTSGRLNEITLLDRAMTPQEVQVVFAESGNVLGDSFFDAVETPSPAKHDRLAELRDTSGDFRLVAGPELQFIRRGVARVRFETEVESKPRLAISAGRAEVTKVESSGGQHVWEISGVARNELITFRIRDQHGNESRIYECDGHFDYTRPTLPSSGDMTGWDVRRGLEELGIALPRRGVVVLWAGDDTERLATLISTQTEMDVISFLPDAKRVDEARATLLDLGVYGRPATVLPASRLDVLPPGVANIVLIANTLDVESASSTAGALLRAVKPEGFLVGVDPSITFPVGMSNVGAVPLGEKTAFVMQAARHEGASAWSHMYGRADNTAYAGESLADAKSFDDMAIQWCGRPGPRYQSDRGNRKPSPLAAGGRLYLQGLHRMIGMDAHNGTILWSQELPEVARFNVPRDCSNWCADKQSVFVAVGGRCKVIDGRTGQTKVEYDVWNPTDREMDWGFVARHDQLLLGSPVQSGASFTEFWGSESWYDAKDGEQAKKVCSDGLFALNASTGLMQWSYQGGLVVNPTISVSETDVIFVECRAQELIDGTARRLDGDAFWQDLFVVSLDVSSGKMNWETPALPMPGVSAVYGVVAENKYLLQSSQSGNFAMYALDCDSGKMIWRGKYDWEADHHGKHLSRPAVVGGKVYMRPLTLDLENGNVLAKQFPVGHQCGTYTASKNALFLRAGSLTMWDGKSSAASRLSRVRPDCWISTIPAEGMLLSPEGGGGCSCGGWIETSMGFAPRAAGATK